MNNTNIPLSQNLKDALVISKILYAKLSSCSPFCTDASLRNIINGILAKKTSFCMSASQWDGAWSTECMNNMCFPPCLRGWTKKKPLVVHLLSCLLLAKALILASKFKDLACYQNCNTTGYINILWVLSFCLKQPVPNWQGTASGVDSFDAQLKSSQPNQLFIQSLASEMNPGNWGWKLDDDDDDELLPIMCDMNSAPDILLKIIHCNCKTGCSSNLYSCKKYGLPCSFVYGSFQVVHCDNQVSDELGDIDEN
ncbi:hypothetical protein PR048_001809 [Dryococelus australis]|uniref:Uncharacterized protein n=1 Tax=Dryococelus australis TaxID=614101 RepID=A0ABQ9IID4_9NEOP|nr:hypothetical protein PR048_001809 [Dryococelus australis]